MQETGKAKATSPAEITFFRCCEGNSRAGHVNTCDFYLGDPVDYIQDSILEAFEQKDNQNFLNDILNKSPLEDVDDTNKKNI